MIGHLNIGDRVIITGGTKTDWDEYYGKPYYIEFEDKFNRVCRAYVDKEILEIIDERETENKFNVYDLKTSDGECFSGFWEWELAVAEYKEAEPEKENKNE